MATPETSLSLLGISGFHVDGAVDFNGLPAVRSRSGGWRSSFFIIGVELAERFAYYGVSSNLITYLTGSLHLSIATAAENVNVWAGVGWLLPLFGAFISDSYLGRYKTILFSSFIYIIGLAFLTLSAVLSVSCDGPSGSTSCSSPSRFQVFFFFFSLYLVVIGQGGHKPCVQAFGADQFDETNKKEQKAKSSFFNWWYFGICLGGIISIMVVNFIQENVDWGLGYGIPCLSMVLAQSIFLVGTFTYRFKLAQEESPFTGIVQVFVAALRKARWPTEDFECSSGLTTRFRFLNRAAIPVNSNHSSVTRMKNCIECTVAQVEEVKRVLNLIPIWATCLMYGVVFAQCSTFFTKQGNTMDRRIGTSFIFPAAALQSFTGITIVIFIPIYEGILVPVMQRFTQIPSGITMLQRTGIGMFLSVLCVVAAAVVEMKRLNVAREAGLVDMPNMTVPLSIWWLLPQYLIFGLADVFAVIGLQEFFYYEMPEALKSMGIALYLSTLGVGYFLSSLLISLIENLSREINGMSWFNDNLNKAHLDYFYWLLAYLSLLELFLFVFLARSYVYKSSQFDYKDEIQHGTTDYDN